MTAWQDISTAPKDGTRVLVWSAAAQQAYVAAWMTALEDRDDSTWIFARDLNFADPSRAIAFAVAKPTHWMPLPKPPATNTSDSGSTPKDDGARS